MTVKIVDKQLYEIYELVNTRTYSSETEDVISFVQLMAERMAPEDLNDNGDVGKIVKAIIDGVRVELYEPLYEVPMPEMYIDGDQQYLYLDEDREWYADIKTSIFDSNAYQFKLEEIPEPYRQWAVEVKQDE